ncbi:MAG: fatty acid desaturase, partial [Leptospiraceae bacterium]|nr:fatty acid desaturase [Leptospiraceae bacterium]
MSATAAMPAVHARPRDFLDRNGPLSFGLILFNWAVVAVCILAGEFFQHPLVYILSVWLIGTRMVALAEVIGHDSVHYNLFQRRGLNRWLDFMWFLPLFETWEGYREAHQRHHNELFTENDPAVQDYKRWGLFEPGRNYFWLWFIRPFLFFDTPYLVKSVVHGLFTDRLYALRMASLWVPVLIVCTLTNTLDILFYYWIIPYLWSYPALIFWSETGEHYKTTTGQTRNTLGFLERFFISPHNDRYHAIHHRYASIPWFNLKRATDALMEPV